MKTGTMKQTAALLALTAAALFTSCAPQANPTSYLDANQVENSNILGGLLADSNFQKAHGIVQLKIISTMGEATCTGSLIARDLVLTAAHCLADENLRGIAVLFGLDDRKLTEEQVIYATNGAINPDFLPTDDKSQVWNDIALVKLEKAAPEDFQLAKLPDAETIKQLSKGSKLTLAGYGITNAVIRKVVQGKNGKPTVVELPGRGSGTLRKVSNIVVTSITADQKEMSFNQTNLRGACHGDSGGPALLKLQDGSYIQVGVTSRGTNELGNCNEGAIYTGVYGQLEWIALATEQLNKPAAVKEEAPKADDKVAQAN
ncbi:MAG: trypsin-like serine protease [Pseudobdellovibrio sp.]|nr:trypsin-like serine protease [Pseudobdellovibrio sp.]